jgi:aspartyl-tRNA(Asn)/glutamyl-tRNA(Gln) amidotransferase subunit A
MTGKIQELTAAGAASVARAVATGQARAIDVLEHCLAAIRTRDGEFGAFLRVDEEGARRAALAVDAQVARGEDPGPLAGVVVGVKDQIVTQGLETTCASRILKGFIPPYDATAVARLRARGAVVVGKNNQDEFGMGSSTERSAYFPTRNPWDPSRVPGGSSGGSAAAVALGMCGLSLGTDTGGSVRQPAAMCGVVGLKPTYGRVSRYGAVAYASSLDQIGPIGRSVHDVALGLKAIAGHDPLDSTSVTAACPDYLEGLDGDLRGLRVGLPAECFAPGLDAQVRAAVEEGVRRLQDAGATVVSVSIPRTDYAIAAYYLVATAEASSNLARYDGVRYGARAHGAKDLRSLYTQTRREGFGPEVKRRILLGTYALSAGYYDAYYRKAQAVRTLLRRDFDAAFAAADVLVTPTSPCVAFPLGEAVSDPLQMYLMDIYTISANLVGVPAISVPCGFSNGMPVGLQLVAPALAEHTLLRAAMAHELRYPEAHAWPAAAGERP